MPGPTTTSTSATDAALLGIAAAAIRDGLAQGAPAPFAHQDLPDELLRHGASFVSLHAGHALRGCVGKLVARVPLAQDVHDNAFLAAFRDPRFPPVRGDELEALRLEVALLEPTRPLTVADRGELIAHLEEHRPGLVLRDGDRTATFLPKVHESLTAPEDFLRSLLHKAGLPPDHWSGTLELETYATREVSAPFLECG